MEQLPSRCTLTFVAFLVVHPLASNTTREQYLTELSYHHKSIDIAHGKTACKMVLTDKWSAGNVFPRSEERGYHLIPNVEILFRSEIISGCPLSRIVALANFLNKFPASHVVFLDTNTLVVDELSYIFRLAHFDLGVTLTAQPSQGLEPNGKTVNSGVLFISKEGAQKVANFVNFTAHECLNLPRTGSVEQLTLHHAILEGQRHNARVVNLNGKGFLGDGQCLHLSVPTVVDKLKVALLSKRFNCPSSQVRPWTQIVHFTRGRKGSVGKSSSSFMQQGKQWIKQATSKYRGPKDDELAWKARLNATCG